MLMKTWQESRVRVSRRRRVRVSWRAYYHAAFVNLSEIYPSVIFKEKKGKKEIENIDRKSRMTVDCECEIEGLG